MAPALRPGLKPGLGLETRSGASGLCRGQSALSCSFRVLGAFGYPLCCFSGDSLSRRGFALALFGKHVLRVDFCVRRWFGARARKKPMGLSSSVHPFIWSWSGPFKGPWGPFMNVAAALCCTRQSSAGLRSLRYAQIGSDASSRHQQFASL